MGWKWLEKSAGRSFLPEKSNFKVAAAPPSAPVTYTPSPTRAPERRTALPFGTEPRTTTSARIPPGDWAVSPPARVTWNRSANLSRPPRNWFTQDWGKFGGRARDRNAAIG